MNNKPFIIGISGGSGSGKTTFVKELSSRFSETQVCILSQDNYYKPREEQFIDENGEKNFDLPESFKENEYHQDVLKLVKGDDVILKEYTYNNPLAAPKLITYKTAPIIIIEGIFIYHFKLVSDLMDFKIFIDADEHIKLIRRIQRDRTERNYPIEDVLYRYQHHVFPAYQKYILPYKPSCDIVVNNNVNFDNALNSVNLFIKEKLETKAK
ncbi:MAG TPA: AAA family ATPase [Chitinophagales bacterium]|jgi:uridine kinase|nr:AAA family ATPase [Chitinophagales bacterium]MBP6153899.1 AAA family ATPase [Chitinophagales bacterium]HQV78727.1 AAA family ATPase [Chitinophagales bacterium]HQW79093.1 AAA family ATPase [Chitinophagales bacterium]HRB92276.1 AAA family ATPase [Chitinophagales bacterium]